MFFTLTSSKYPNGERGERRRHLERKDVVSNLPVWIVMVDLEVDDGDEPEEDMQGNPPIQAGKGAISCDMWGQDEMKFSHVYQ